MNKKYRLGRPNAQSTLEYAIVVACIVAALIGMQFYVRRGIQGRLRAAGDEIGEQYTPLNVESKITTETTSNTEIKQSLVPLGEGQFGMKTEASIDETTGKTGTETLGEFENGLF